MSPETTGRLLLIVGAAWVLIALVFIAALAGWLIAEARKPGSFFTRTSR